MILSSLLIPSEYLSHYYGFHLHRSQVFQYCYKICEHLALLCQVH